MKYAVSTLVKNSRYDIDREQYVNQTLKFHVSPKTTDKKIIFMTTFVSSHYLALLTAVVVLCKLISAAFPPC